MVQTSWSLSVMPQGLLFPLDLEQDLPVPSSLHQQTPFPLDSHYQCLV